METGKQQAQVFLSYKRNSPDQDVALQIYDALRQRHRVFIDQTLLVGAKWAAQIEAQLRQSDYLIVLLSQQAVDSEMVQAEVETAVTLRKKTGKPVILPVRLAYLEPFKYPLSARLNPLHWAYWGSSADTKRVIDELMLAIESGELGVNGDGSGVSLIEPSQPPGPPRPVPTAQPVSLEMPEGTMIAESGFYVTRTSDSQALAAIGQQGVTITIKGPRQMGKSSLLIRLVNAAGQLNKRAVFMDFQLFGSEELSDKHLFFRRFCSALTAALEMDDLVEQYWAKPLGDALLCTSYVERYLLKELGGPLALAMDEVDTIFNTSFNTDFFSMLRSWHNSRAINPIFRQLDLVLVTSTEPYQLIENLNQSPFNVGTVIELVDFTQEQVSDLNGRHGSPLSPDGVGQLMALLNGHPYLVRRALYLISSGRMSLTELLGKATDDRGPFGDHLRYHLFRLHRKSDLIQGLRKVILHNNCSDPKVFFALRGAGLVRGEGAATVPRCRLYADYFRERLNA
jgi:hypothetical protein